MRKTFPAVTACDGDQHNLVERFERTDAVDDQRIVKIPALARLVDNAGNRLFGHAGIMLERKRTDRRTIVDIAHLADEGSDRADSRISPAQPRNLGPGIEILVLNLNHQPPVTGGKTPLHHRS